MRLVNLNSLDLIILSEPQTKFSSFQFLSLASAGFDSFFSIPTSSSSPTCNLWALAKSSCPWLFTQLNSSSQHISLSVVEKNGWRSCIVTAVYASTKLRHRRSLWKELQDQAGANLPWCVIGDFNTVSLQTERFSIRPPNPTAVAEFQVMLLDTGLLDIGFRGSNYTWTNNRQGSKYVAARLDRALLVEEVWSTRVSGKPQFVLPQKLKNMKQKLKARSVLTHFSCSVLTHFSRSLTLRSFRAVALLSLPANADKSPDPILLESLQSAKAEQKSRIKWKTEGDRNTRFLQATARSRSYVNSISSISINGISMLDPDYLK
ncbi:hypothetical protein AMTRI_Chr12g235630 [Amborella trichopoda]